jgi:hypothetical protein
MRAPPQRTCERQEDGEQQLVTRNLKDALEITKPDDDRHFGCSPGWASCTKHEIMGQRLSKIEFAASEQGLDIGDAGEGLDVYLRGRCREQPHRSYT